MFLSEINDAMKQQMYMSIFFPVKSSRNIVFT